MSERSIRIPKDTNMIKLTFCCKFWVYSLRMTLFGRSWYLWPVMACKMSVPGISDRPFGYYRLSVCLFFCLSVAVRPSDALGLKARVDKKGEFPPCGVGKVPPSIIYVGGSSSTFKFYFSLCVNVCFLLKISDAYRFISFRLLCKTKIDKLFKHWTSKQTRSANSMSILTFRTTHAMVLLPSE